MKLLHVTDLHFNRKHCEWITNNSQDADLLCVTGDFLDLRLDQELSVEGQISWLSQWLSKIQTSVFVCSGNHDENDSPIHGGWLSNISGVVGDGSIVDFKTIKIGCIPYDFDALERFNGCDVLLHHEPPAGLKVSHTQGTDFGSSNLRALIKCDVLKPKWILSGHIHHPERNASKFRGVAISNPGSNLNNPVPNHHWITL